MKRIPFNRPEYYDSRVESIDEQICEMLQKRKKLSDQKPGMPPSDKIAAWAKSYDLEEELLTTIFSTLRMEEFFKKKVEPSGFRKHVPVMKSAEVDERMFTVTFIRQFENASVVHLHMDWHEIEEPDPRRWPKNHHTHFELDMAGDYQCRQDSSSGSTGRHTYEFIVTPALPDDLTGVTFTFKEYDAPFMGNALGDEIVFEMDRA
ncbi:hypothetical protein CEF21_07135 [Bacillus sp. FJAT-42376]|uniref:hypothetical protein n=1 Tax=Bacillus sp. FJAT-42376 TaxID=2014076 RepID=UPI000F4FFB2D|nr:hypothetical protein [Bacillus sp. FJAT-42376]AZB42081.1 hypothetical protein CEF21_07135 [Bacillus sp. FJAT-42376]